MGVYVLSDAEKKLFHDGIQHGDRVKYDDEDRTIRAGLIRHFVLGLPVVDDAGILRTVGSFLGLAETEKAGRLTGAGISIRNGIIDGRVDLDAVTGTDGGPICPLEFRNCTFNGGFSGAHANFNWLSFRDCTFVIQGDPIDPDTKRRIPTIDLTGAGVEGDLDMRGIHPQAGDGLLWIRAPGIQVNGEIDLSLAKLRAPPPDPLRKRLMCEEADDALNLMLAEIKGDLQFLNGSSCKGRIKLRAAQIGGDVWLSGASIEAHEGEEALFLQGARIGGLLMMDGRFDCPDDTGPFRKFICTGGLSLKTAEIGTRLRLDNAIVRGPIETSGLVVANDMSLNAEVSGPIDMSSCRIGGSLDISGLNLASSVKTVSLAEGEIGSLKLAHRKVRYKLIETRRKRLACIPGLDLVETLWGFDDHSPKQRYERDRVQSERWLVQLAFLIEPRVTKDSRVFHLDGHARSLKGAIDRYGCLITSDTVAEFVRIHDAYVLGECGTLRVLADSPTPCPPPPAAPSSGAPLWVSFLRARDDKVEDWTSSVSPHGEVVAQRTPGSPPAAALTDAPRFANGQFVIPKLAKAESEARARGGWIVDVVLTESDVATNPVFLRQVEERLAPFAQPKPLLQVQDHFNLESLTCGLLEDRAGRDWGDHLDQIKMNHFVYHRTTWESGEALRKRPLRAKPKASGAARLHSICRHLFPPRGERGLVWHLRDDWRAWRKQFRTWRKRRWAELTPKTWAWLFDRSDRLRYGSHWTSVQYKRNWIYRQFRTAGLSSSSKYRIQEHEYRSQPFEQAIKVARAEGREDYATYFEILKERIEWSIFIERSRVWFWALGIAAVVIWMVARWLSGASPAFVTGLFIVGFFAFLPQMADLVMRWGFGYLRRPIRAVSTLLIAFVAGWAGVVAANQRDMLVIDVAPVADVVGEARQKMRMGSAAGERVVRNVHCGDAINEALYALDVLIPLIDLRQESRCEVGIAEIFTRRDLDGTAVARPAASYEARTREETFWMVLKALYAVAGWFIVSLSILTFAHINRAPTERGGEG